MNKIATVGLLLLASSSVYASTIRVEGYGPTRQSAKLDGLRNACEQSLNTIVLSEREHQHNETLKNEIITACSGYVERYKIVKQEVNDGVYYLTMDVKLSTSRIADRFIVRSGDSKEVDGEVVDDTYNYYLENKRNNLSVLETVLESFPKYSFNIKQGDVTFQTDQFNNLVMVVPYKVAWNNNYLDALHEGLNANKYATSRSPIENAIYNVAKQKVEYYTARRVTLPDRSVQRSTARISFNNNTMLFNDYNSNMQVYNHFMKNIPVIALEIQDIYGETFLHSCHNMVASQPGQVLYGLGNRGLDIKFYSRSYINNNINIVLYGSLKTVQKVSLKIVSKQSCR